MRLVIQVFTVPKVHGVTRTAYALGGCEMVDRFLYSSAQNTELLKALSSTIQNAFIHIDFEFVIICNCQTYGYGQTNVKQCEK